MIQPSPSFGAVLQEAMASDVKVVFCEKARHPFPRPEPESGHFTSVFSLVGLEGGFTAQEIAAAISHGFTSASLGPRVLRAETATVAASALIQYLYGDLGRN